MIDNLKDVKIPIPEIPVSITRRIRNHHTNNFYDDEGNLVASLTPDIVGLYAERFDDGWYWVCGCHDCLENGIPYSYIKCEKHNRCIECGTHRSELTDIPWGTPDGILCVNCREKEKEEILQQAVENGHDESDCKARSEIICPHCATECDSTDFHHEGSYDMTCDVCEQPFQMELTYITEFTTTKKKETE